MLFDWFVIPFTVGFTFLLIFLIWRFSSWIMALSPDDKRKFRKSFFSKDFFISIKEIFLESLIHRKIFKTNPLLGFMHMSLAFGWFLLICFGNLEVKFFSHHAINPPYYPIFFKFFEPDPGRYFFSRGINFLMDIFLLMVLAGVCLAWFKRMRSKSFGLQKTTNHIRVDKIALTSLWFIFPLRFLAESFTSGIYHNGSFFTGTMGGIFASFLPVAKLAYPTWWAYSMDLGIFFVFVPFSRYMHIPAEVLLIFMRNAGIKAVKTINIFSKVEINSCSRCGICIDTCQLARSSVNIKHVQPSYFIRDVRYNKLQAETAENCLMCGRCRVACPVGIDSLEIRIAERNRLNKLSNFSYEALPSMSSAKTDVIFFAGCMTNLTPGIKKSMEKILDMSGVKYEFLDKDGGICCGRPLMLAGQFESARVLMDKNIAMIKSSGAKILVTSCPICFKTFKEDYNLDLEVVHHTQFILRLIEEEKITLRKQSKEVIYHDPCELGRGSNIYIEPRIVINHAADLYDSKYDSGNSLCCGGSLGNTKLQSEQKSILTKDALQRMDIKKADALITACPLCKKTFAKETEKDVLDIAELVADCMIPAREQTPKITARSQLNTVVFEKR